MAKKTRLLGKLIEKLVNKNLEKEYTIGKEKEEVLNMPKDYYVREQKIIETTEMEKETELIKCIIQTREELKAANRNFEYAQDDLVDYYTYQIKANQAKLNYLFKLAKAKGIEVDMISDMQYSLWQEEEAG